MTMTNKMRDIFIEKVTVNIGVGSPGDRLENAKTLLTRLANNRKPVETLAKRRDPVFKLRKGLPIGAKVTLRGEEAKSFLTKALAAKRRVLSQRNFDKHGNFAFGIHEYIDFPGAKYDPGLGMFGFDICVSLIRRGKRVSARQRMPARIGRSHLIKKDEAIDFVRNNFNTKIE